MREDDGKNHDGTTARRGGYGENTPSELERVITEWESNVPISYDGILLKTRLRIDLMVENLVVVELKAVEKLIPLHTAQVITYLKLTGKKVGLLINFNTEYLKKVSRGSFFKDSSCRRVVVVY